MISPNDAVLLVVVVTTLLITHIIPLSYGFTVQRPFQVFDNSATRRSNNKNKNQHDVVLSRLFSTNNNNNNNENMNDNDDKMDWDGIGESQFRRDEMMESYVDNVNKESDDNNDDDVTTYRLDDKARKFVGQSSLFASPPLPPPPNQASLPISTRNSSNNSNGGNFVVDEREVQLVSIFERTLPIQVVSVFAIFCFIIYIGLSGGITDGSDRYMDEWMMNDIDTTTQLLEPEISDYLQQQQQQQDTSVVVGPSVFL